MRKHTTRGLETALEQVLTNSYKAGMISYMANHPEDFEEAVQLAIADKQPYSWRAAWLLWSIMEVNDQRIQGYVEDIIGTISNRNDDHERELFKILYQMDLDEENEGVLFNVCLNVWKKINKKPSVRCNAFKILVKVAQKHPDLAREFVFITQNQYMNSLSSTVKKSISKMIKEFNQNEQSA